MEAPLGPLSSSSMFHPVQEVGAMVGGFLVASSNGADFTSRKQAQPRLMSHFPLASPMCRLFCDHATLESTPTPLLFASHQDLQGMFRSTLVPGGSKPPGHDPSGSPYRTDTVCNFERSRACMVNASIRNLIRREPTGTWLGRVRRSIWAERSRWPMAECNLGGLEGVDEEGRWGQEDLMS